jgi:hypothetical protein
LGVFGVANCVTIERRGPTKKEIQMLRKRQIEEEIILSTGVHDTPRSSPVHG